MNNNNKVEPVNFNFEEFREAAISQIKSGQPLTGKGGILTPLLKELLEAALEGEMDSHLQGLHEAGQTNRRNGKSSKTVKRALNALNC